MYKRRVELLYPNKHKRIDLSTFWKIMEFLFNAQILENPLKALNPTEPKRHKLVIKSTLKKEEARQIK